MVAMNIYIRRIYFSETPELAAYTLMAVSVAAFFAFLNKYISLPSIFFVFIWGFVFLFLAQTISRALVGVLSEGNFPAKIYAIFLVALVLLSAYKTTATGFSRHDEIYSWGMWGVQHSLKQAHDLYYNLNP